MDFPKFKEYLEQRLAEDAPDPTVPKPTPIQQLTPQQQQARLQIGKLGADVIKQKDGVPPGGVGAALQVGAAQALQRGIDPAVAADLFPAMNSKTVPGQVPQTMSKRMKKGMRKK